jgi:NitT/TauT family transport system ATP-binding protein
MLTLSGVGKRFGDGTQALADIDLVVSAHDFLVLLGPSGCGKSTLLRLIAGLEAPSTGTLRWTGPAPAAGEIGYVFQDPTLMPWATSLQNVSLPLRLRRSADAEARARAALAQVGLADFANARPKTLSGGMRMRVSIARALVTGPRLLLMDEPFAALDEFTRHRLQDECLALTKNLGCTTVFVTHSLYEAATLASRVVLMSPRPGRIAAEFAGATDGERAGAAFQARVARLSEAVRALHLPT